MTVGELRGRSGELLEEAKTPQMIFHMKLPRAVPPMTLMRRGVDLSAK